MSERLKSTSNEISIEELDDMTKNLKSYININDDNLNIVNPGTSAEAYQPSSEDSTKVTDSPFKDVDLDEDEESKKEDSDTESIDEEALKATELELSDDQKEERRIIAEELKLAGNNAFKVEEYKRSIDKYTEGLKYCPLQYTNQRAILYCNRSAAKMKLKKYKPAIKDCTRAIQLDENYVKAYIRRAQSYESTNELEECLADYKKVLEFDPSNKQARAAEIRLPPLIEKKNEELKTEMLGKLKELGNIVLKPFGLSTNNFQMERDPETKGYKINFKQ